MLYDEKIILKYLKDLSENRNNDNLSIYCPVCVIEYNYSVKE